jgi:hypothetical protein
LSCWTALAVRGWLAAFHVDWLNWLVLDCTVGSRCLTWQQDEFDLFEWVE